MSQAMLVADSKKSERRQTASGTARLTLSRWTVNPCGRRGNKVCVPLLMRQGLFVATIDTSVRRQTVCATAKLTLTNWTDALST